MIKGLCVLVYPVKYTIDYVSEFYPLFSILMRGDLDVLQDADASEIKIQVCVYAFDLLYLNGKPLVREPFRKRRELLHASFNEMEGGFMFAKSMISSNTDQIAEFLDESIKGINV